MLKMVDGTGIIGVDMICPLGVSTPQPPNYDRVELEGVGMLVLPNSLDAPLERLELVGKTEQVTTTGAQLFEASRYEGVTKNGVTVTVKDGVITATGTPNINTWIQVFVSRENYQKLFKPENKIYLKTNKSKDCNYDFGIYGAFGSPIIGTITEGNSGRVLPAELPRNDTDFYFFIDVKIGTELKGSIKPIVYHDGDGTWEPYTGGKPSPSPEYPQEIVNAGRLNEDTGKYEIDVTINSGNLFKLIEHTSGYYVVKDGKVQINKTIGYSWTAVVNNLHKQTVILHITTAINTRYRMYCTDLEDTILYKYEDSSANTNDNSHTFNMPDGAKKIYVSVLEINSAEQAEIALNLGSTALPFEPYKEQSLTLTSDRPLTKWDRLVEQSGQIGWLYGSKIYVVTGNEVFESRDGCNIESYTNRYFILNDLLMENDALKPLAYMKCLRNVQYVYSANIFEEGFETNKNQFHIKLSNDRVGILASDDHAVRTAKFSEYMKKIHKNGNPIEILYATTDTVFLPLQQEEQNAIRALKTYYPTTVITADGGELDPDIKVTYRKEI